MQIRKVGLRNEEITIVWEDRPLAKSETTVSHELTSTDAPSPEFHHAMYGVVAPALRLLELPEDYGVDASFRSLRVSQKDDGRRGFTVAVMKPIAATNAPFNISTPHVAEASEDEETGEARGVPDDLMEAIAEILKLAERFTKGFDGNDVKTGRWKLHRSQGEKGIQLGRLVRDAVQEHEPDLVGFEEPLFLTRGMAALALRYGLQMVVKVVCEQTRTSYVGVPVATVKKHATGKGNAKKPQMIQAAMDASGLNLSSDEADAYWVADYLMNAGVSLGEVA